MLPRLLWVRKEIDLKQLHMTVFKHLRQVFSEWADWTHPETTRVPKAGCPNLRNLIEFPYRLKEGEQMTKQQFDALSDEEAFNLCFKGVVEGDNDGKIQTSSTFDIERMAYQLEFKNSAGYYGLCKCCEKPNCRGCLVPYNDAQCSVADLIDKFGLRRNDTLFEQSAHHRGKELICQVTWHSSIMGNLFDFLATAQPGTKLAEAESPEDNV